jgi:hypothetical protein
MHFGEENPCFDKLRRIHVKLRDRHSASTYFYLLLTHHLANNLRIPLTRLVSCFSLLTRFILFFCIPRRLSCHPWPAGYFASPAWAMTRRRETTCTAAPEEQSRSAWRYKPCVRVRHSSCRHSLIIHPLLVRLRNRLLAISALLGVDFLPGYVRFAVMFPI